VGGGKQKSAEVKQKMVMLIYPDPWVEHITVNQLQLVSLLYPYI
jgi:hypothetical protein